jgi:hypothetical protein
MAAPVESFYGKEKGAPRLNCEAPFAAVQGVSGELRRVK